MEHRYMDISGNIWNIAAISELFERGTDKDDFQKLMNIIKRDPFGKIANNVLIASRYSDVYGYPALFKNFVEDMRRVRKS